MTEYDGPNLLSELSEKLESKREELSVFFTKERAKLPMPLYASVDIRDAGWKVAAVDANAYPAGFNNVGSPDLPHLSEHLQKWLKNEHPNASLLHIWPEGHTRNKGYVENLITLQLLFSNSGMEVTVGSPDLNGLETVEGITGVLKLSHTIADGELLVLGKTPDLVILNNDLSHGPLEGIGGIPVAPPQAMGWYQRRKSNHFRHAQPFIDKVADILDIDPWLLGTHWFVSEDKCLEEEICLIKLAAQVDSFLEFLKGKYDDYGIEGEPVLFVKNDSGTYGLGILEIRSGDQLLNLSNRKVNKLTYGKGGAEAIDFLIQEGVPTALRIDGYVIEPCTYGAGGHSCSTFYRANPKKGVMANLNTPSTRFFQPDEISKMEGGELILDRVDSWHALVAELAMLAMGSELAELTSLAASHD
ncbi:MAG: glutamate--cysteine ligase [Candidatus Poseidoniales archaeon]|nr:glutamate--cysteine ligase [Candidatus Poseidoniales archaeon]